jgi:nucleotide-binding universal stress UspA family protein
MAIKSILAPITGYEKNHAALVSGLRFARRLGAFVDVLHVRADPRDAVRMVPDASAGPVGERRVEEAAKAGADLLVMGAYGRSRACETIFGGATRSVLNESALPVLMAR